MARNGKVNVRDLDDFRKKLKETLTGDQVDSFIEECAKELAARLLAKVIKRTPVGQKPKLEGDKFVTVAVRDAKGRKRNKKFLSAEAARLEEYWGGYVGGTLRRGWTEGKNQSASTYAQSLKVHHFGDTYVIEVVNPVEYASYVEFGHRQTPGKYVPALGKRLKSGWVEGKFMLTISEQEIERDAPRILENKLKKKLGECFK